MYNLTEYSNNYFDTSGSLWQFKSHGSPVNNDGANSSSFKYKSSFFKPLSADDNGVFKDVKITFPLKYLTNFWRSLEKL